MNGKELSDLREQIRMSVEDFSAAIGISPLDYQAYVSKQSIEKPSVVVKVHELQLKAEEKNFSEYINLLRGQPTGPFSSGKVFAHVGEICKLKTDPIHTPPVTMEWHLSNRCNHDCQFCTFRESVRYSANASAIFPENLVEPLIEDIQGMGVKAVVYSGGGEPLLFPGAARVLRIVSKAGIRQGLITNGSRIGDTEIANTILDTCDWVRISIDAATQGIYEATHGKGRNLAETIENIRKLVSMRKGKKPTIGVSFLLTKLNYPDLLPAARMFKDVGVDYFQVKPIVISAEDRLSSGNIFWRTGIFNQLIALPDQASGESYKVYTLGFKFADMMNATDKKAFNKCHGHPFYPVVTATGEIYVCCLMIGQEGLCYGTVSEASRFRDIWFSDKRVKIGESVNVRGCPINCKLSETNKALEAIMGRTYEDEDFLN